MDGFGVAYCLVVEFAYDGKATVWRAQSCCIKVYVLRSAYARAEILQLYSFYEGSSDLLKFYTVRRARVCSSKDLILLANQAYLPSPWAAFQDFFLIGSGMNAIGMPHTTVGSRSNCNEHFSKSSDVKFDCR